MLLNRRFWITCAVLYLLSQLLFLINIQFPKGYSFDEFHYVPAALRFLEWKETQNWEHPPLAKLFMALGIALWGDRPIGWRFMSTVFGSLSLIAMYAWARVLFKSEKTALWVALITAVNQLLYVQARIGMLDTFMFGFILWALVCFSLNWESGLPVRTLRKILLATGILFGAAIACKWFAIVPWVACILLVAMIKIFQVWKTSFVDPQESDWYQPKQWRGIQTRDWIISLGVVPVLVYFLTFLPYFMIPSSQFRNINPVLGLIAMQKKMWAGQLLVVSNHPYMSHWTDWPGLARPIWYAFDKEGSPPDYVRGVLLLGNPLMMWSGLVALLVCAWGWVRERRKDAFIILYFYFMLYGCWALIPRKVSFYYYYYPAGMILSLALAYVFHHGERGRYASYSFIPWMKWVFFGMCLMLFIHFFPILAALKIPAESFRKWMWLPSWI